MYMFEFLFFFYVYFLVWLSYADHKLFVFIADYLKEMVYNFHDVALGNFCKILAVTLSELDMYEHKTSCKKYNFFFFKFYFQKSFIFIYLFISIAVYAQTKQKKSQNFYIRDINQGE